MMKERSNEPQLPLRELDETAEYFAGEKYVVINSQSRKRYFHIWFVGSNIMKVNIGRFHSFTSNVEIIYAPNLISGKFQLEFITHIVNGLHAYNREYLMIQLIEPRYTKTTEATFPI